MINITLSNKGVIIIKNGKSYYLSFRNVLRVQRCSNYQIYLNDLENLVFSWISKVHDTSEEYFVFKWIMKHSLPKVLILTQSEWNVVESTAGEMNYYLSDSFSTRRKIFLNTDYGMSMLHFFTDRCLELCDNSSEFEKKDFNQMLASIDLHKFENESLDHFDKFRISFKDDILQSVKRYIYPVHYNEGQSLYVWDVDELSNTIQYDE